MTLSRRSLVRGLGMGVLGAGALTACGEGMPRGRGRRRRTTTNPEAAVLSEPDTPLVIGQIGADYGRMAAFEQAIAVSISEASIDVNQRWKGLFGHPVTLLDRHVMKEPGEDLTAVVQSFAENGATCVITSIDEESLIQTMPAFVEAGLAVIDVLSSGMTVRSPEVQTANLLVRLCPNERTIAAMYAEIALGANNDRGGPAGTVALLSEETAQGRSLAYELDQVLKPANGSIVSEQFYPVGDFGDVAARVSAVLENPPALLVFNGGAEVAPFLSELYKATLDEGQRPSIEFPKRLSPHAVVDYSQEPVGKDLAPECFKDATGFEPGTAITIDHENMMLNRNHEFLRTGYAYSQHGYDAFTMICLAAQHSLEVDGTAIASGVQAILTGNEECTDYEACRLVMRTALEQKSRATVAYQGRLGPLELGAQSDARTGEIREYTWNEANVLEVGSPTSFEDPG